MELLDLHDDMLALAADVLRECEAGERHQYTGRSHLDADVCVLVVHDEVSVDSLVDFLELIKLSLVVIDVRLRKLSKSK